MSEQRSARDAEQVSTDGWRLPQHCPSPPPVPPCSPVIEGRPAHYENVGDCRQADWRAAAAEDRGGERNCLEPEPLREPSVSQLANICDVVTRQTDDIRSLHEHLLEIWSQRSQAVAAVAVDPDEPSVGD